MDGAIGFRRGGAAFSRPGEHAPYRRVPDERRARGQHPSLRAGD